MSHALRISDEVYQAITAIAAEHGQTPEGLVEAWLKERVLEEQEASKTYSKQWLDGLDDALAQAEEGQGVFVGSTEELFRLIDETPYEEQAN